MSKQRIRIFVLACGALLAAIPAGAKCTVTLKFNNTDTHEITVLGDESQSRVNGGTYSKMNFQNVVIAPGGEGATSWKTNMSCGGNAKRDLRFKYRDSSDNNKYEKMVHNVDIDDGVTYGPYVMKSH